MTAVIIITCRRQVIYDKPELRCFAWLERGLVAGLIPGRAAPAHYADADLALSPGREGLAGALGRPAHRGEDGGREHGIARHTDRKVVA